MIVVVVGVGVGMVTTLVPLQWGFQSSTNIKTIILNWRGTTASSKKVIKGGEKEEVLSVDKRSNPETRPDKRLKTPRKAM